VGAEFVLIGIIFGFFAGAICTKILYCNPLYKILLKHFVKIEEQNKSWQERSNEDDGEGWKRGYNDFEE
jgi:hypothetical protein